MTASGDRDPARPVAVHVPPAVSARVLEEGRRAAPEEACGLLVGLMVGLSRDRIVRVTRAISCENTAPEEARTERFEIDPLRVIETERSLRGDEELVVGFYHSHPVSEAVPSGVDRPFMELWPDMVWLIVGNAQDSRRASLRVWRSLSDDPERPVEIPIQIPA